MKRLSMYFLSMILVAVSLFLVNVGMLVGIAKITHNDSYQIEIGRISDAVTWDDKKYVIGKDVATELESMQAFAMLINEDGKLVWQFDKPEDVPEQYTLSDIVAFSKWYLNDYPVYTWGRDDGILVIGLPKNSIWKYPMELGLPTMKMIVTLFPYLIIFDLLIFIVFPIWITKKWMNVREKKRSEWIAGVSHDIRTPLSIVLGNAEKGSVTEKQCLRIRELVNNLNTENKLEMGTGKWQKDKIKMAELVREMICDFINVGGDIYEWNVEIDPELENSMIYADKGLVSRILENLISNAIGHNEDGCCITVCMQKQPANKMAVIVKDNGKGCNEDTLRELNRRLSYRYLPEHGLGLRVVKQIAKKYRYGLHFQSQEGKGFEAVVDHIPMV